MSQDGPSSKGSAALTAPALNLSHAARAATGAGADLIRENARCARSLQPFPPPSLWASSAGADDSAQPVVNLQQSLAAFGISLGGGVTGFGQGLAGGDGEYGVPFGGKADVLLGFDGGKLGLWPGLSVSAHLEQNFGQSANEQGAGAILPVNTALAFPTLGGTTTDLSLIVTQKFGDVVSISLGKFNMLDVIARTPLIGGGGETTFWNIGLAAPVSGVTPPYILGGVATSTPPRRRSR